MLPAIVLGSTGIYGQKKKRPEQNEDHECQDRNGHPSANHVRFPSLRDTKWDVGQKERREFGQDTSKINAEGENIPL